MRIFETKLLKLIVYNQGRLPFILRIGTEDGWRLNLGVWKPNDGDKD